MAPADRLTTIEDTESIECGKDAAKHFAFAPGYLNLNHRSYGACPTEVRSVYRSYQDRMDARPDAFTRYEYRTHLLDQSRQVLRVSPMRSTLRAAAQSAHTAVDASDWFWVPAALSATPMEGKAFAANFQSVGTPDDSSYLCIKAALDWRRSISWNGTRGEHAIMGYLRHLAVEGGQAVAKILDTEMLNNPSGTVTRCALTNVRLPLPRNLSDDSIGPRIMRRMMDDHNIAVVVLPYRGNWWVRLSAQVYLTVEDFQRSGEWLRQMCEKIMSGTD